MTQLFTTRWWPATSAGNTAFYLYGLGAIGQKTDAWSYSLPDGTNTPRQLSDFTGEITLSARYTPWGDTLDTYGTGNFTFGYFGGVMDAATGLLYVGNGQYYDPATGRFLTRDARPNNSNPYVPWDPTGAILGPLAAMALFFGKRRKRGKGDWIIMLLVLSLSVGLSVAACQTTVDGYNVTATPVPGQPNNYTVTVAPATVPPSTPSPTGTPMPTITATCTVTPSATNTLMPTDPPITPTPGISHIPDPKDGPAWGPVSTAFYNFYLELHKEKYWNEWYWQDYGSDGHLSLVEFAAIIFTLEVANAPTFDGINMNDYVEAMGRAGYTWCTDPDFSPYHCDPSTTDRGLIYFLVEYSSKPKNIINNCPISSCDAAKYFRNAWGPVSASWGLKVAQGIRNPLPAWKIFDKNALYGAGNIDPQVIKKHKVTEMHKDLKHKAHYESPGPDVDGKMFITTFCENAFLRDNMTMYNAWGCKLEPNY